jgi:hypothetical protein
MDIQEVMPVDDVRLWDEADFWAPPEGADPPAGDGWNDLDRLFAKMLATQEFRRQRAKLPCPYLTTKDLP